MAEEISTTEITESSPDVPTQDDACAKEAIATDPLAALQAENAALQAELSQLKEEMARSAQDFAQQKEFRLLFPDVDPSALPKEVTESTLPLCAAYALYCRKKAYQESLAQAANAQNAQAGSGAVHHDGESDGEFTVEEIRRMSPDAVRRNYSTILRSLKKHK